jgi:UDP-N-acetylmuramoyl-L-alanyl-D-glutamate--2,6-diaminopimelate ligase
MGEIATRLAERVIITSDNSRSEDPEAIINDIMAGVHSDKDITVFVDRREAIAYAVATAQEQEIILIAGKGHENYEITKDGKHPFSEKDEVTKALRARFGTDC